MGADWRWLQTFLVAAEHGSLSKAAQDLDISQPTASRHVLALEEATGLQLFVRHSRGLSLTDDGARLLDEARGIDQKMRSFLRPSAETDGAPRGVVRLSANEPVGVYELSSWYGSFRRAFPGVSLEVVVDNHASNLLTREADLAVRMFRPTQPDLVIKKVGEVELGLYASAAYLKRHARVPLDVASIREHTVLGFDLEPSWLRTIETLGMRPEQFTLRSNAMTLHLEAIRAGSAIGTLHRPLARRLKLIPVFEELELPSFEVWLAIHASLRGRPAIRAVVASLHDYLTRYLA